MKLEKVISINSLSLPGRLRLNHLKKKKKQHRMKVVKLISYFLLLLDELFLHCDFLY